MLDSRQVEVVLPDEHFSGLHALLRAKASIIKNMKLEESQFKDNS